MGQTAAIPEPESIGTENLLTHGLALVFSRAARPESQRNSKSQQLAVKRAIDVFLGSFAIIALLPLIAAIAVAIKLDSLGPILYASPRVGRQGLVFTCYKFRTMCRDADLFKPNLRLRNERAGAFFKLHDDPRVTRLGHWLRRYSLDELPQLWNVLRGEMSLVGPRPHPLDDVARYEPGDFHRLDCTPGLTGLWQVTARRDPSFRRCVALDLDYIHRWNLLLDFQILARTLPAVVRGSGE
jgi:lipopolysaccharide/colanic/teichoic acid biosynthesis glycosyltransferase